MHGAIDEEANQAKAVVVFQLHKSLGLSILLLSIIRLMWRWRHPPPALPSSMPAWEMRIARATHWVFYALMIAVPLSGWLYVSTQWRGDSPLNIPTLWFGTFEVPHLFGLNLLADELRAAYASLALESHELLAWSMAALLILHVAAALKHHFIHHDDVLVQMAPLLNRQPAAKEDRRRSNILRAGLVLILIAVTALIWAVLQGPAIKQSSSTTQSMGSSSASSNWKVVPENSTVRFSGVHAGLAFNGHFRRWQADINFNADDLEHSQIHGNFETASITDGIALHDETLLQEEWFDVEHYPLANYRSTRISKVRGGNYIIEGLLTIKEQTLEVPSLSLILENEQMSINGSVEIDRTLANLGMESDPDAEYVSRNIRVDINIQALALSSN